jgi:hypothetical protein
MKNKVTLSMRFFNKILFQYKLNMIEYPSIRYPLDISNVKKERSSTVCHLVHLESEERPF